MPPSICVTPARTAAPHDARTTVVVLTYRRAGELARTLAHLSALPERPPIVVVDNASGDDTARCVRTRFPHVTLVRAPANLGAAGRNLGAALARTRYVAFCDDDTWWAAGALARAAELLDAHPSVAALTARVLVGHDAREDPTCARMARSPLVAPVALPGRPILGLLAGATIFRRAAFVAAGGYHPRLFIGGEETLLALDLCSAGHWLVYAPQLTVHHHPSALRDAHARTALLARNALWTAWLRLPAAAAWRHSLRSLPRLCRDHGWRAGWRALAGLGWTLRERRPLGARVEQMRRRIAAGEPEADR
ncbi:glycosyltransferase [Burkholderia sp. Bp9125]|nr:glycosyltransferase [Burkholderia sp. Bp9125]